MGLDGIASNDFFQICAMLICFLSFVLFLFFCVPGSEKAQLFTLRTAKALAMTAVDVVCNPDLLAQVREDFSLAKLKMEEIGNLTVHQTDE